eukprot:Platyproteum_vivax@DN13638_c0_g1_i1.p1
MTVWQWDLVKGEPVKEKQVLKRVFNLKREKSGQRYNSCLVQSIYFLLYIAENGAFYSNVGDFFDWSFVEKPQLYKLYGVLCETEQKNRWKLSPNNLSFEGPNYSAKLELWAFSQDL